MSTLSIFDAAREAPHSVAFVEGATAVSFAEAAERALPLTRALVRQKPRALALTPRADTESLLWLYAAFASGTPLLLLHQRAAPSERAAVLQQSHAVPPDGVARAGAHGASESLAEVPHDAPLVLLPTSGSSGTPRIVTLSRAAVLASARASAQNLGWQPDDVWLLCLPLAHAGGLSIVTRCLLARRSVLLFEPGAAGLSARIAELSGLAQRASLLSLVPSVLSLLLESGFAPPSSLRAVLLGGAGCSPELARRAHAARIPLLTSYGLTETASQVVTRRYAERFEPLAERAGCVSSGHPLPGVELRLDGERIALKAASLFSGYLGSTEPALTADGFFVTNDRGELGPGGELYVRGRSDDVIVSGGENIDPLEVEAALVGLPGVRAVCVFGTPSEVFGQVVTALLVCADPRLGDPNRLTELLAQRLARHKLPRRVARVESLPLTASGKVDRRACVQLYAAHAAAGLPA